MASTDERSPSAAAGDNRIGAAEGPHGERRRRAMAVLAEQRTHFDQFELELAQQLQRLADEVAQTVRLNEAASAAAGESEALTALQAQLDALRERHAALDAQDDLLRRKLEETQLEQRRLEQELRVRDALLKDAEANDEGRRLELAAARQRLADLEAQLAAAQQRQSALDRELEAARQRLADEREETKSQRRRIAREFKQQRAAHLADLERRRSEIAAAASSGKSEAEQALAAAQTELLASIRQVDEATETVATRDGELEAARATIEDLRAQLVQQASALAAGEAGQLEPLKLERDELAARLAAAEASLNEQRTAAASQPQGKSDLERRFEMAVDELREMKRANAELESRLKNRPAGGGPAGGGGLDWEAQKQRLLASLEADDNDDEDAVAERLSIEGTIRITDDVVARKDREIEELRQLLDSGPSSRASDAAAAELLDRDEIIQQERERLSQAQAEWRDKIGKAEIDISVERAKVARERAELEEKIRQFVADQERLAGDSSSDGSKPARGRWLARLGLKEIDDAK